MLILAIVLTVVRSLRGHTLTIIEAKMVRTSMAHCVSSVGDWGISINPSAIARVTSLIFFHPLL